MRHLTCLAAFGLLAGGGTMGIASQVATQDAANWEIGPDVRGRNYSVGMPLKPTPAGRGWSFEFPYPHVEAGHVHAVTFDPGPLSGASKVIMRYRVDAARGVRFVPQETPAQPATVSLYFQRRGDNWSGRRQYEFYRWYAPTQSVQKIAPGEYEIVVNLADPNWTSVNGRRVEKAPAEFQQALAQTGRIGIAFGSPGRRAHGVYSTGPARFTLLAFRIM